MFSFELLSVVVFIKDSIFCLFPIQLLSLALAAKVIALKNLEMDEKEIHVIGAQWAD
jgi:hypothetical protein